MKERQIINISIILIRVVEIFYNFFIKTGHFGLILIIFTFYILYTLFYYYAHFLALPFLVQGVPTNKTVARRLKNRL